MQVSKGTSFKLKNTLVTLNGLSPSNQGSEKGDGGYRPSESTGLIQE